MMMIAGSGGLSTRSRGMPSTSIHFIVPARPRARNLPLKTENNKCKKQEFPALHTLTAIKRYRYLNFILYISAVFKQIPTHSYRLIVYLHPVTTLHLHKFQSNLKNIHVIPTLELTSMDLLLNEKRTTT